VYAALLAFWLPDQMPVPKQCAKCSANYVLYILLYACLHIPTVPPLRAVEISYKNKDGLCIYAALLGRWALGQRRLPNELIIQCLGFSGCFVLSWC
jgi:hypothetical protein